MTLYVEAQPAVNFDVVVLNFKQSRAAIDAQNFSIKQRHNGRQPFYEGKPAFPLRRADFVACLVTFEIGRDQGRLVR